MQNNWRARNFANFYSQHLSNVYLCRCFLLLPSQLQVLFLNLLPFILQFVLQCLQFSSFLFKALLYLHQAYLILLVLLVLQLNLVEHLVYTSNFLSEPVVLFAHVILQIDQFRSGHHIFLLVIKLLGKFSSRIMAGLPRVFDQNTVIQISLHALNLLRGRFCGLIL